MEIIGWLQIMLSPTLVCLIVGALIYFNNPTTNRLIIAVIISIIGLVIGIIYATRIWKTKGTMWFISRVSATQELDEPNVANKDKKEIS